MDLIATIKDSFDRVTKKQKLCHSVSLDVVGLVSDEIEETLTQIQLDNNGVETKSVLTELKRNLDALLSIIRLQRSQKKLNLSLSKLVKVLENSCHPDISLACKSVDFDIHLVNKILIHHFYQQGLFEVGDCLVKEAGEEEETGIRSLFLEIHQITESMKLRNIEPALRWISANRGRLEQNGSKLELELELVSLRYGEMLREGNRLGALKYAGTHLSRYGSLHFMCLQWVENLESCPNAERVSLSCWDKMTNEQIKEYYNLLDQSSISPLTVALSAGFESLPTLLKLVGVMSLKKQEWQAMKQLPVPLELGNEFQFHSVFVCPVTRDQSSEENPPMMMPCRHVISKQSLIKLSKNCARRRFICPCCSALTSASTIGNSLFTSSGLDIGS